MKCQNSDVIQSYIDGELEIIDKKNLEIHLNTCKKCTNFYNKLKEYDNFSFEKINTYKGYMENLAQERIIKNPTPTRQQISVSNNMKNSREVKYMILKYKKLAITACAVTIVAVSLSFQPVRAAVSEALTIFRTQDVSVFKLTDKDINDIQKQFESKSPNIDLKGLGNISMSGGDTVTATKDSLKNINGLNILIPDNLPDNNLKIQNINPSTISFKFDVNKFNSVLRSFGSTDLLPKSIDGKTVSAKINRILVFDYLQNDKNYIIHETKLPDLEVPNGVDIDEVHDTLLSLPIIPEDLKQRLKSVNDWKSTIYIPMEAKSTKEISINGYQGYIFSSEKNSNTQNNVVVWSQNKTVYSVEGNDSSENIIKIAQNMK